MSLYTKYSRPTCPHCGNSNWATIETNGLPTSDPEFSYLCTAPMPLAESTFDVQAVVEFDEIHEDSMYVCGMQWSPNVEGGAC